MGGDDTFTVSGLNPFSFFYGDAGGDMSDHTRGGDDAFTTSGFAADFVSTFYGDAGGNMFGHAAGGNDAFTAGGGRNTFFGDASGTMSDDAQGGSDTFMGGAPAGTRGINLAYGDALAMSGNAQGGNDTLIAGDDATPQPAGTFDNTLIGDAQTMSDYACGGNDKLVSGTGNDDMWGDAQSILGKARGGNDTFRFNFNSGHDRIEDFGQGAQGVAGSNSGTDHIDVSALGITNLSQLSISAFDPTTHESTITFSPGNDVIVHSQVALTSHDFLLA
ncbi:hypothetical protein ACVWW5_004663 [Bradyrhizobium sp. LM3.4]